MRLKKAAAAVGILGCLVAPSAWAQNSISVIPGAASAGTDFGLRVNLPLGHTNAAYVMVGPAHGFNNEDNLRGSFYIKPFAMDFPDVAGQKHFQIMAFLQGFGSQSLVKLIFFLQEDLANPENLFITAWHWNDLANGGAGGWVFSGNGFFASRALPNVFAENRIDFEWTRGNPGNLKLSRTNIHSTGAVGATYEMFNVPLPGQATATINYVFAGHFAGKSANAGGYVDLDEFTFDH